MNEQEWLGCADPSLVLEHLWNNGKLSERKARLFAVACARGVWPWMLDERSRQAVEVCERYADGLVGQKSLKAVRREAFAASKSSTPLSCEGFAAVVALDVCMNTRRHDCLEMSVATAGCANSLIFHVLGDTAGWTNRKAQCDLIRCIFANPFGPVLALDPAFLAWHDGTVRCIAESIYDERAFERLPILADALEEAGCTDPDILGLCRSPGNHVRGCWVVDLILGRS